MDDDDAAILAQIQALKARLGGGSGSAASGSQAAASPSAKPQPQPQPRIVAPQSPPRQPQPVRQSRPQSSAAAATRGPAYISSAADRGVEELRQLARDAPRPRARPHPVSLHSEYNDDDEASSPGDTYVAHPSRSAGPVGFVKALAERRELERGAKETAAANKHAKRDDRLRLMEELNLVPGPWDFGNPRALYADREPYSGHRVRNRQISHADFQERVMDGRYFLSPSLIYTLREKAEGWGKGSDGDYDLPVPGDWVLIATIVRAGEIWYSKGTEEQEQDRSGLFAYNSDDECATGSETDTDIEAEPGARRKRKKARKVPSSFGGAASRKKKDNSNEHRQLPPTHGRNFDLLDMSQREEGGENTGGRGHDQFSMMTVAADHKRDDGTWVGGSRGAYEKLQTAIYGGTIIALVNPRLTVNKRNRGKLMVKPRDANSVIIIGQCPDYAQCTAKNKEGKKCGSFVDRRNLGGRGGGSAICDYHLEHGVAKTRQGRQAFANGTGWGVGVRGGGGGGGGGYGGKRKFWDDDWGGKGWGNDGMKRPPVQRDALSFEGLQGRGKNFVVNNNGAEALPASDPRSNLFSVAERYGRAQMDKERARKKAEDEEEMLLQLEARRAGWSDPKELLASRGRDAVEGGDDPANAAPAAPTDLPLPAHSPGALLIADAQRKLREERALKRKREADEALRKKKRSEAARREEKVRSARRNPGSNDRLIVFGSESESDEEGGGEGETGAAATQTQTQPQPSQTQAHPPRRRGTYSAEAIKAIGFDPLSDARARQNQHKGESASQSGSALLARHKAPPSSLPTPKLHLPAQKDKAKGRGFSNVRAPPAAMSFGAGTGTGAGGGAAGGVGAGMVDLDLEIV